MNGQPPIQLGAKIDWSNSLTEGLTFLCAPGIASWEMVGDASGVPAGTLTRQERMLDTDAGVANWGFPMKGPALDFQCEYTLAAWFWMWPNYVPTSNTWTSIINTNAASGGVGGYQSGLCVNRGNDAAGSIYFAPWDTTTQRIAYAFNGAGISEYCSKPIIMVGRCGQLRNGATLCHSNLPRVGWTSNAMAGSHVNSQSVFYVGHRTTNGDASFECPVIIGAKWNRYLSDDETQAIIDDPGQLLTRPSSTFVIPGLSRPHAIDGSPFGGSF